MITLDETQDVPLFVPGDAQELLGGILEVCHNLPDECEYFYVYCQFK